MINYRSFIDRFLYALFLLMYLIIIHESMKHMYNSQYNFSNFSNFFNFEIIIKILKCNL